VPQNAAAKYRGGEEMFDEDQGQGSVSDRLSEMIWDRLAFIAPVRIISRPETLTIVDYRPTLTMFLTAVGFVILAVSLVLLFFRFSTSFATGLWVLAAPCLVSVIFLFRGTLREIYFFDKRADTYAFVRQFIHRKDVIEGSMSQFTGAYVKTETSGDSDTYFVMLKQEGMFLTGVSEQALREVVPMFNSFDQEAEIADAIEEFLRSKVPTKREV